MKKSIFILLASLVLNTLCAQQGFGVELTYARHKTFNAGMLEGGYETIHNERDVVSGTFTAAVLYRLKDRHTFKLAVGKHHNGRMFDVIIYSDDFSGPYYYNDLKQVYNYLQISPRYEYHFNIGRFDIPIEAGISINKRLNPETVLFSQVRDYNYDLRLAAGLRYEITNRLLAGFHAIYNHNLDEYQYQLTEQGTHKPRQIGVEMRITGLLMKE